MNTEQSPKEGVADGMPVRSFVDPDKLAEDLNVDMSDLDGHIRRYGGLLSYYSAQAARARHQYENIKTRCAQLEALLEKQVRDAMVADTEAKVTEAMIAAAVKRHPKWGSIQSKVADARLHNELAENAYQAFRSQKDMLVQISMDRRTERQGELRIQGVASSREAMLKGIVEAGKSGQ